MTKKVNIHVTPADRRFLEMRGARSHRGGREFSRAAVLTRLLQGLEALLEHADPRPHLAPEVYAAAAALLTTAWTLQPIEIRHLEDVLASQPELPGVLARFELAEPQFLDAIRALPCLYKYGLVDRAIQVHAPDAAGLTSRGA